MKIKTLFSAMMLTVIFFTATQNFAQQGDQAAMMKKWQENISPGAAHKEFAKQAGNWKAVVTTYMGAQEVKMDATSSNEMLLGGRYLKSTIKGTMMGMPFEGIGIDAYDNVAKEYLSMWIDTFGTGILLLKGKKDDKSGEIVYTGSAMDPITEKTVTTKTVTKVIDDDHSVMTMYMVENGVDTKSMMVEYTRVK